MAETLRGVTLSVDAQVWRGWTSVSWSHSLDELAATFQLGLTERWPGQPLRRGLKPGMVAALGIPPADAKPGDRNEIVLSGYLDAVEVRFEAESHEVSVRGRDRCGDLADCSVLPPWEFAGIGLAELATRLLKPFDIPVVVQTECGAPFGRLSIQPGDTVHDVLERTARQRGVLLVSDRLGRLLLTAPGAAGLAPAALVVGGEDGNVKAGSVAWDWSQRHSEYRVLGQREGHDDGDAAAASGAAGRAVDDQVTRYRPIILLNETQAGSGGAQGRAEWQRAVVAGRSLRAAYTVQGWRAAGKLWEINQLVDVDDPITGLHGRYLITGLTQGMDPQSGTTTQLEVRSPDAYAAPPRAGHEPDDEDGLEDGEDE